MNQYKKIRTIGQGQFGDVLLVRDRRPPNVLYALKAIFSRINSDDEEAAHLEVQVLSSLNHPNIVKYEGSFFHNDMFHIVMEYCEGGDLAGIIKSRTSRPFSETQILDWFVQLSMAVDYVHSKHILHRDLKSNNVFVTANNIIKLGDFGIARVLDRTLEQAKTVIGTPYYMSPEVCESKPYSYKSDIWALGCILYEMCTRKHAFDSTNLLGLVFQIVQGKYPPIDSKSYSSELLGLVDSLLSVNPLHRPDIRDGIFKIPFIETHMKRMCRGAGSLGRARTGKNRSSPPPKFDDSLCLLRSSSSWVQSSRKKDQESKQQEKQQRSSSEDTVLTEICDDGDEDVDADDHIEECIIKNISSPASDAEYAASPAAASSMHTTPRFKHKKLSHIRRSTHRRRTRTSKARMNAVTNRSLTGELKSIDESRREMFRTPVRRSHTYKNPDDRPIVSSGKYKLPLPESPQQKRRFRKHTDNNGSSEGKEGDSKLDDDDDDDDDTHTMSQSPSIPKIGRKQAIRMERKRTVSEVEYAETTSGDGYSSDSDFEGTATMMLNRPSLQRKNSESLDDVMQNLRDITTSDPDRVDTFVPPPSPDDSTSTAPSMNSAYVLRLRENLKSNALFRDVYSFLKSSKRDDNGGSELYEALRDRFGKEKLSFCFQVDQFIFLEKMCERKGGDRVVGEPRILNLRRKAVRAGK